MAALTLRRFPHKEALLSLGIALSRLAGIGLVAIGVSGSLALAAGTAFGKDFVSSNPPDVTYTVERCADFLEYYPQETCRMAATAHHFDEVVTYRLAAGLLGLFVLAGERVLAARPVSRKAPLPPGIIEAAGATA